MTKLCIALDTDLNKAFSILDQLKEFPVVFKVGPVLFLEGGIEILEKIKSANKELFLDLKLYDIPNTVRNAVTKAERLGVDYITLHILGGEDMLKSAVSARKIIKLLGVTLLTSQERELLRLVQSTLDNSETFVLHLSKLAAKVGLDGVVCSAYEVRKVKKETGMFCAVPGIRLYLSPEDQRRTSSPEFAIAEGADMIILGREIYKSKDPARIVEEIISRINGR